MVKRSSDEPADKASERLRQFEEARQPLPDEEDVNAGTGKSKEEEDKDEPPKKSTKSTNKNK